MIKKKNPPLALLAALSIFSLMPQGAMAFDADDVSINGFLSQGYLKSSDNYYFADTENGSFEFNEVGVTFSAEPYEKLRIGAQLLARDLGEEGNNDVVLSWGFGDYQWKNYLGIRAGKVKLPMGFYNQTREVDFLRTAVLLPQSVYSENMRDLTSAYQGGGIYGNVFAGPVGDFEYELFAGTINIDNSSPFVVNYYDIITMLVGAGQATDLNVNMEYLVGGALRWNTPLNGLRFGVSDLHAKVKMNGIVGGAKLVSDTKLNHLYVFSAEYIRDKLTLSTEYMIQDVNNDLSWRGAPLISIDTTQDGYYLSASYQILDWFELGTYYSVAYPNNEDRDGHDLAARGLPDFLAWQKDWAVSTRFDIGENIVFKLEAHFIDGAGLLFTHDNPPGGIEENWMLYAAKVSFNF